MIYNNACITSVAQHNISRWYKYWVSPRTYIVSPAAKKPPFPSRLTEKILPSENQAALDLLDQLKQMKVKIPLLDAIKKVPIYSKAIKEAYIKNLGRKKKDPIMSLANSLILYLITLGYPSMQTLEV